MAITEDSKEELEYWANLPVGLTFPIIQGTDGTVTTNTTEFKIGVLYDGRFRGFP